MSVRTVPAGWGFVGWRSKRAAAAKVYGPGWVYYRANDHVVRAGGSTVVVRR